MKGCTSLTGVKFLALLSQQLHMAATNSMEDESNPTTTVAHVWAGSQPVPIPKEPLWQLEDEEEIISSYVLPHAEAIDGAIIANVLSPEDCAYVIDLCERRSGFEPSPQKQTGNGLAEEGAHQSSYQIFV